MIARVISMVNGLMIYWNEVENAAVYHVHLLIGDKNRHMEHRDGVQKWVEDEEKFQEIDCVDVERKTKYYSFVNLAPIHFEMVLRHYEWIRESTGRNYYLFVEAEDRNGYILDQSDRICGRVKDIQGGNSL